MPYELTECLKHSERQHVVVHEAGHALAAIQNDLFFTGIRLDATKPDLLRSARHEWGRLEVDPTVLVDFIVADPYLGLLVQMAGVARRAGFSWA